MLRLLIPPNAAPERRYAADVLFGQFLGLSVEISVHDRDEVIVTNGDGRRLVLDDSFFEHLDEPLLRSDKVPCPPLRRWTVAESGLDGPLAEPDLPILFGRPVLNQSYIALSERQIHLGVDVLGSAFFMLTRYEESVSSERDEYNRFPASASIAYRAGFLHRPILNEYLEILWQCLKRLWGGLVRRRRDFRVFLSHDVDQPFLLINNNLRQIARTMAGDVLKRKNPVQAVKRAMRWGGSRLLGPHYDPAYTFNYIMEQSEKHGLCSAFYFIPSLSAGPPDYRYGIYDRDISNLMSDINDRGHEIGYHASFNTYKDQDLIQAEVELLREACKNVGVQQTAYGSRQHYLQIEVPVTLRHLADAGLAYDTSLGYADHPGFRCGICWEYEFYDLEKRKRLGILERPLIVMECSAIDEHYMGLGLGDAALEVVLRLANLCRRFSGDFTLLWHNTRLVSSEERNLFERILAGAIVS